jgi:hypothetical protein
VDLRIDTKKTSCVRIYTNNPRLNDQRVLGEGEGGVVSHVILNLELNKTCI